MFHLVEQGQILISLFPGRTFSVAIIWESCVLGAGVTGKKHKLKAIILQTGGQPS